MSSPFAYDKSGSKNLKPPPNQRFGGSNWLHKSFLLLPSSTIATWILQANLSSTAVVLSQRFLSKNTIK